MSRQPAHAHDSTTDTFTQVGVYAVDVARKAGQSLSARKAQDNDPYTFWRNGLAIGQGRQLTRQEQQSLGLSMEPQLGFFRKRNKGGTDIPVAIWMSGGEMVALAGDRDVDAAEIWTWCCNWPISHGQYTAVTGGASWPDEPPVADAVIGHNISDDPFEALRIEFEGDRELAKAFLKEPVKTQEQADRAAVWSKKLAAIAKKATDLHKVEKQPSLDESRRVDDKWRDLKDEPKALSTALKRAMDVFLNEQARIEAERQKRAREEADRIRREAEEAARQANANDAAAQAEADRLKREADQAEKDTQTRNAQAGRTGAKVSLRTFVSAEITDYDALLVALKDRPEIREVVQSLANRAAKSGVNLPGMKIHEEKRAA
ncbi:hypothetical protein [Limoniibacter endophyticus]|uniref:Uncharacterized protein n=1 Tax=Limoniibacter endophyticus TaxID=1565040 RepID=A0A8J3DJZ5_9HYPH|nr:hypothetical protein [Limoniibacter endophyticus]GHC79617.1 hypothetical protein GCM10010136_32330 [Limoniibacter endophyticus]